MNNKKFAVTYGPRGDQQTVEVELNGFGTDERLTPNMARRAAQAATGKPWGATVWSTEVYGYRLYRYSARKVHRDQ